MKLCLGTVQLGMNYGVAGQKCPSLEDSMSILDFAVQNEIDALDTANAYGKAEEVVGEFLSRKTIARNKLAIISKTPPNVLEHIKQYDYYPVLKKSCEDTMRRLKIDYLDGYLFHTSKYVFSEEMTAALYRLKEEGYVKKVGVSIYETEEAKAGLNSKYIDLMQLPFNLFDRRMKDASVFDLQEKTCKELHTRSVFLQGLLLMDVEKVPSYLEKAIPLLECFTKLSTEIGLSKSQLAMGYVRAQKQINRIVIGVDTLSQLQETIALFQNELSRDIIEMIESNFKQVDRDIILPSLWKK